MLKAEIAIAHKNCWASEISENFPDLQMTLIDMASTHSKTSIVILYAWDKKPNSFKKLIEYLESKKNHEKIKIIEYEILEKYQDSIFIKITSEVKVSLIRRIVDNNCFIWSPAKLKEGKEFWTIVSSSEQNINKVFRGFSKVGKSKINYIKKIGLVSSPLTNKQKEAMRTAVMNGYYEWPRKIKIYELAKKMKISKGALRERLRKAENKFIKENVEFI
ncbi:MAG: helix-turn-helix domain-containing protein [Nanoarchaeota archaeon]|nr:helix-turn-helix domain-containing protein [Nanoarchaeota archaeon]